jgi:UDP-N-acetyl-2-amino-2-deoxyglucuronate dehydrogenase
MKTYNVGIIGCGAIFRRHYESITKNKKYKLVAVCDIQPELAKSVGKQCGVEYYTDYKKMVKSGNVDFVTIATPNSLHYEQSIYCLKNNCDILVEKPVAFTKEEVTEIIDIAKKYNQSAYCVLQVRLNPTVLLIKEVLDKKLLGNLRGVSFIQRWQRPLEYFTGWRAIPEVGGGTLYEIGIHYLDIIQYLFGNPQVLYSKTYETKHNVGIEDTIYSIFDYGNFGGTCEVTISSEPKNLECSLSIIGSNGYVKLGGKALNIIETADFLSHGSQVRFDDLAKKYYIETEPNNYGSYQGSCPNHPFVYKNLNEFKMGETINVIDLIDDIYNKAGKQYRRVK